MKVWTVQITSYEDDYKHRYDSGVYPQEVRLFKTKKMAEEYIIDSIIEEIEDQGIDISEDMKKYFKKDSYILKKKYKSNMDVANELHQTFLSGSYVEYLFTWTINETDVKAYKPLKKSTEEYQNTPSSQ